jgi:hypothetical protein
MNHSVLVPVLDFYVHLGKVRGGQISKDGFYFILVYGVKREIKAFVLGTFKALKIIPKKIRNEKIMIVRFITKLKRKISKHLKIGNQIVKNSLDIAPLPLAHKDDL